MPVNKTRTISTGVAFGLCSCTMAFAQIVPAFTGQVPQPQIIPAISTMPAITPAPALKYRDPANPITIGEVSDLQATKAQAEYASKFGYTDQKMEKPSLANSPAPRPRLIVSVLATWSKANKAQAEAIVDGRFTTLTGGETLASGVKVEQVLPTMLVLSVTATAPKNANSKTQPKESKRFSLHAGSHSEIEL
jgi:hypothetical protein